jgi:hypothetical protein
MNASVSSMKGLVLRMRTHPPFRTTRSTNDLAGVSVRFGLPDPSPRTAFCLEFGTSCLTALFCL